MIVARVWKFDGGSEVSAGCNEVNGDGVSCVSCVNDPLPDGEPDDGEIGTGTAVTCAGRLGSATKLLSANE